VSEAPRLPQGADDPLLDGWYHTIELGDGLVSHGHFDHRPVLDRYGLPDSLEGKTVLDVGTAEGFFAFELERRGARRVVATDVASQADWDWMPRVDSQAWLDVTVFGGDHVERFRLAHSMLGSQVEHRIMSVYDLSPDTVGTFDLVFCGSLLLHLRDPLRALAAIRSVTAGVAIIETAVEPQLDDALPGIPLVKFGARDLEDEPGEKVTYWWMTTPALEDMLAYAGFGRTEVRARLELPPQGVHAAVVAAYSEAGGAVEASPRMDTGRRLQALLSEKDRLRERLDVVESSRSWRLTGPLRRLAARLRGRD
jgi:tRNA (mo5U34)-methyltransferase